MNLFLFMIAMKHAVQYPFRWQQYGSAMRNQFQLYKGINQFVSYDILVLSSRFMEHLNKTSISLKFFISCTLYKYEHFFVSVQRCCVWTSVLIFILQGSQDTNEKWNSLFWNWVGKTRLGLLTVSLFKDFLTMQLKYTHIYSASVYMVQYTQQVCVCQPHLSALMFPMTTPGNFCRSGCWGSGQWVN